jgi:hypothetical protein
MTLERAVFDLHANPPPLDGCPMFAPAYMGRKRRGEAPSTVRRFSGLTNERVMTDRLSVPSTEDRVPHISLVFREMWDTTVLDVQLRRLSLEPEESWACGPPKVIKNASVRHLLSMEPLPFPCHPDRSEAERRDLRFRGPLVEMFFGPSGEIFSCPRNHRTFTTTKPRT